MDLVCEHVHDLTACSPFLRDGDHPQLAHEVADRRHRDETRARTKETGSPAARGEI